MEEEALQQLIPIEGIPPERRHALHGCPFEPRFTWRLPVCWTTNPPLVSLDPNARLVTSGPNATHRSACHNIPTPEEAAAGRPLRDGFVAAPPPGDVAVVLGKEGPASMAPSAGGLPLPPEEDRR